MAPLWRRSTNSFSKALPLMDDGEYVGRGGRLLPPKTPAFPGGIGGLLPLLETA